MATRYLHFSTIYIVPAYALAPRVIDADRDTVSFYEDTTPWVELSTDGGITVELTADVDEGRRVYTTNITARLFCDDELYDAGINVNPCSFLLEAANGRRYLIGTGERPHPVPGFAFTAGSAASEAGTSSLNIHWISPFRPLEVL